MVKSVCIHRYRGAEVHFWREFSYRFNREVSFYKILANKGRGSGYYYDYWVEHLLVRKDISQIKAIAIAKALIDLHQLGEQELNVKYLYPPRVDMEMPQIPIEDSRAKFHVSQRSSVSESTSR